MRFPFLLKWLGIAAVIGLVVAGFMPWVYIESRELTFTGMDTRGSNFGKPAFIHYILAAVFLLFLLIPRLWAKRANLPVVALNLAWAVRNFFMIAACQGGECPVRKTGLYLSLLCSVIMLLAALFPDMKLGGRQKPDAKR